MNLNRNYYTKFQTTSKMHFSKSAETNLHLKKRFLFQIIIQNSLAGFSSRSIFATIDRADIDAVEEFIRNELSELYETKAVKLLYGCEAEDAFGKFYATRPNRFKFLPGDMKLISSLVQHVNTVKLNVTNDGTKPLPANSILTDQSMITDYAQRTKYFRTSCKQLLIKT